MKKTKAKVQKEEVEEEMFDTDIDHIRDELDEEGPRYTQEDDPFS